MGAKQANCGFLSRLLELCENSPEIEFEPGKLIIEQDRPLGHLFILVEGEVEIVKDGTKICRISKGGSAFGEMSALLGVHPTASVLAVKKSRLVAVEDSVAFLSKNIEVTLEIARLLADRVRWLTVNYAEEIDDGDSAFWRSLIGR